MSDGYFPRGQDEYEAFIILSQAKTLVKINDYLYNYRTHIGISTPDSSQIKIDQFLTTGTLDKHFHSYCLEYGYLQYYHILQPHFIRKSLESLLYFTGEEKLSKNFDEILSQYGVFPVLSFLIEKFFMDWKHLADKLKYYIPQWSDAKISHIGILYSQITNGGAEKALISSCNTLIKYGFKITLYLSIPNDNDTKIDDRIDIVYLSPVSYEIKHVLNYIKCLYHALLKTKPDILICHDPWNQHTLWRLLLSHCLRIPFLYSSIQHFIVDCYFLHRSII